MASNPDSPNYHPLVRRVARALDERCKVGHDASIVVACSGGADSVALLRGLAMLAERRTWSLRLIVGHVQHHLRGEAAERDAALVAKLAGQLGLGYERRDIEPGKQAGNVEANARRLRYAALADIALKRDAGFVATAHHADDQLETMLMRLIRGTSVRGLRGIAWRRRLRTADESKKVFVVRPMLRVDHEASVDFLNQLDQAWHEDATNRDTARTRARLRHEVIPLIKSIRADAAGKAVSLGEHFDDLHKLVLEQADAAKTQHPNDAILRSEARRMNALVFTQLLRNALLRSGVPRDRAPGHALRPVIEAACDTHGGVRNFDFANGVRIEVGPADVRVVKG